MRYTAHLEGHTGGQGRVQAEGKQQDMQLMPLLGSIGDVFLRFPG